MEIYLIRHTKTTSEKGLCYGQSDVALAESFYEEARIIHAKLPQLSEDCLILSSPLQRCSTLAATFSRHLQTDERLQEINFGDWENQHFDDIDPVLLKQWTDNFVTLSPPNGESFSELCMRTNQFWDELIRKPHQQALIITHAGVIRALLANILQLPYENAFKFKADVGSVHKLQYSNDYTYIHYLNR